MANKPIEYVTDGDITYMNVTDTKGITRTAIIDTADLEKVSGYKYKWCISYHKSIDGYYVKATKYVGIVDGVPKSRPMLLHRYIIDDEIDETIHVDHINHDTLDNRRENLRKTNNLNNTKNRRSKAKNNTSGYRNVCWDKASERWIVQLQVNGKNKTFGWLKDVHEAGKLAEELREKYYGEFSGKS